MKFKTELHCHSKDISPCARVDTSTIIDKFVGAGYSTLVLSNHFSRFVKETLGCGTWKEWIDKYLDGYYKLKKEGEGKINVLLGMELRLDENNNDYLIFGITEEFLRKNEDFYALNIWQLRELTKENSLLLVQAHPFRDGMTVTHPHALDGVEVFNGHRGHDSRNDIADAWASKYGLIKTSGTDFHYDYAPANAGIITDFEITDMDTLVKVLREGNYSLIKDE